jgi:hypothetical protein
MNHLSERFARAGLDLRLASAPFSGNPDIFALDIRRTRPHDVRSEHFLAWTGKDDNTVQVQGIDRDERQLVLFVREARRSFTEDVPTWATRTIHAPSGSFTWRRIVAQRVGVEANDLVVRSDGSAVVQRSTSGGGRHLLVGCDERQLFMCELPKPCSTVKQAHEALRPSVVPKGDKTIRQGEWFFVVPHAREIATVDSAVRGSLTVVHKKRSINSIIPRAGKPHVAEEIVVVGRGVYVRGAVRHPDHDTIRLRFWHRVHRNLEVDQNRSVLGGTWID